MYTAPETNCTGGDDGDRSRHARFLPLCRTDVYDDVDKILNDNRLKKNQI